MTEAPLKVLVMGFGNPGRLDDGLGPALIAKLEPEDLPATIALDSNYQLSVEDAEAIAKYDWVVFADAAVKGPEPFYMRELEPAVTATFTTHSVAPDSVLGLARDLFQASTRGAVLGIRGYEFNEFGETLSEKARANLDAAYRFILSTLRRGNLPEVLPHPADADDSSTT